MRANVVLKIGKPIHHQPEHAVAVRLRGFSIKLDLRKIAIGQWGAFRFTGRFLARNLVEPVFEMGEQRVIAHSLLDSPSLSASAGEQSTQHRSTSILRLIARSRTEEPAARPVDIIRKADFGIGQPDQ